MRTLRSALAMSVLTLAIVAASPPQPPSSQPDPGRMSVPTAVRVPSTPMASEYVSPSFVSIDRAVVAVSAASEPAEATVTSDPGTEVAVTRLRTQFIPNVTLSSFRGNRHTRATGYVAYRT